MKKLLAFALICVLSLALLAGCGAAPSAPSAPSTQEGNQTTFKIGLLQLVEHPSLDEISAAIQSELTAKAAEQGLAITVDYLNA
ncbi:MAG: peptide ABC transporter substrate-binding protein, partial [Ruthenibacterium sp.]